MININQTYQKGKAFTLKHRARPAMLVAALAFVISGTLPFFHPLVAHATTLNCVSNPSACGYADATNTGVPSGTTLINVPAQATSGTGWSWDSQGWVNVTGVGATVSGLNVAGDIAIKAAHVTVK